MMIFGGITQKRQISMIDQCSLTRVGTLEFNFNNGACTTAHDQVYLCFDERNTKQCYTASGRVSSFSKISQFLEGTLMEYIGSNLRCFPSLYVPFEFVLELEI